MAQQTPYPISGTVTLDGSNYHGAKVWIRDLTEGTVRDTSEEDVAIIYTNTIGQYVIDVANNTAAYADGDTVRVFCKVGNMVKWSDVTLSVAASVSTASFTFVRKSGLVDGCKGSPLSSQKGGLKPNATMPGCIDELQ